MKSTEIEAERVVSTSGLLTGRPNASWPRRISHPPQPQLFFFFFFFFFSSPPDIWKTITTPFTPLALTSLLLTPTLRSVVFSLYTMQLPRRCTPHRHMYIRSECGERAFGEEQGLQPEPKTLRSASVASGSAVIKSEPGQLRPVAAFSTKDSVLKIQNRTEKNPPLPCLSPPPSPRSPRLYRIIKPISHRTINGHQRQGCFKRNNFSATARWTPVITWPNN